MGTRVRFSFSWSWPSGPASNRYREIALIGAAHIARQIENVTTFGLYNGLAGMAFAIERVMTDDRGPFAARLAEPGDRSASSQRETGRSGRLVGRIE